MGVKSKKKAKTRLDAYYRLAKEQGYRARSAFKLLQLNRKYDFLAHARVLVDLCAAPGGWCQVAAKYMPVGSKIVGVDLVPIQPIRGVKTFVGDITADSTRKMIRTWLKKEPVDCVIHDGAPNVGGVWSRDLFDQNALVLSAAKMACSLLKPGGWFLTKVFRSLDFHKLLWVLKQLFEKVEATKPLASRMESAEIFVICAGFFAPKQLDPEMFNPQKVFTDVGEEKIVSPSGALVLPKRSTPQGYEEFATISHHVAPFTEFLEAKDPKMFLRSQHELRFVTDEEKALLKSKSSKKELVYLCGDLQQVGEADRRRLLRWREQLLREKAAREKADEKEKEYEGVLNAITGLPDDDEDEGKDEEDEELHIDLDNPESVTRIARELLELRKKRAKEMKKKQKKVVDRKLKQIRGLINYDPSSLQEETVTGVATVDRDDAATTRLDSSESVMDTGAASKGKSETHLEEGVLDSFTVEKLSLVDEADVSALMDKASRADMLGIGDGGEEGGGNRNNASGGNPLHSAPMPLNPVVSVNLATQEDWDMGDDEENDGESDDDDAEGGRRGRSSSSRDGKHPQRGGKDDSHDAYGALGSPVTSATLVEGEEYYMDVDNYGNYIPAKRSARVKLYEGGFDEETEDEEENRPPAKKSSRTEKGLQRKEETTSKSGSKTRQQAQKESELQESDSDDALSPAEKKKKAKIEKERQQLDSAGKQSKWERHHLNIQHVLNDTFPTPSSSRKKLATSSLSDRSSATLWHVDEPTEAKKEEEEKKTKRKKESKTAVSAIDLRSKEELSFVDDGEKRKRKRTRFEDDDDQSSRSSSRSSGSSRSSTPRGDRSDEDDDDEDSPVEVDDSELAEYDVHQGRKDSRRKRNLVEAMGTLTTQELVRQQRKQVLLENKEKRKQKRSSRGTAAGSANDTTLKGGKQKRKGGDGKSKKEQEDTAFEEIPIGLTDPTIRARTLALAQKMLDPKARRDIMDASINKYVFDDDEDLPDWFIKDEQRNCTIPLPVTAEEMDAQRQRFKEMNARPSKKVMEAMGRKYRRAQRLLHNIMDKGKSDPRAREKANQLSVRKLMRAQVIKGQPKKKHRYLDRQSMGQMRRERQKAKREKRQPHKKR